jgi:hypothetical protein
MAALVKDVTYFVGTAQAQVSSLERDVSWYKKSAMEAEDRFLKVSRAYVDATGGVMGDPILEVIHPKP